MGLFDDAGAIVSKVENSIGSAVTKVENTIAGGLPSISAITGGLASGLTAITDGIGGILNTVSRVFKQVENVKLPLPNPLFDYASYTYNISIGILSDEFYHFPDKTYRIGKKFPLLLKSANADPDNRANTPYGKFDFYIDDLKILSTIGFEEGNNTNATNIEFTVIEPYSMGMLLLSIQQLAESVGHPNWRSDAPFILAIEFRGNTETGQIKNIPNTSRYIPFTITDVDMSVDHQGAVYKIKGLPKNFEGLADANNKFKSDMAAKGTSVREMLSTGAKSLQVSLNTKLKDIARKNGIEKPDEIVIIFPSDISSAGVNSTTITEFETNDSATVDSSNDQSNQQLYNQLNIARNTTSGQLIQSAATVNAIGNSRMGFDEKRKASPPVGKDNVVYNKETKINDRTQNTVNPNESDFKFRQDTDIVNAITQVIINSTYIDSAFDQTNLTTEGYRGWFSVDTQVYHTGPTSKVTGIKPRLFVYRVLQYHAHVSSGTLPVNTKPPGYDNLKIQAVKEYNYIFTGKNIDIKSFKINYNSNFFNALPPDGGNDSQDSKQAADTGGADNTKPDPNINQSGKGSLPDTTLGTGTSIIKFVKTLAGTDKLGGGGVETKNTRAARSFQDSLTKGTDMANLEIEILGDPYWIAQSGMGNYTAQPTQFYNLNDDGSVSYQNGEVDCLVNFRTPIDINQSTGLYDFGPKSQTAPVMQFSGLYTVKNVTSTFKNGEFTQVLTGVRRPLQESSKPEAKPTQLSPLKGVSDIITKFADGSSVQTFEDGSKLITDAVGKVTSQLSPEEGAKNIPNDGWGEAP
jgi:hypothetical protein